MHVAAWYSKVDFDVAIPSLVGYTVFVSRVLDLANNTLQGPCRALLADFTGTRVAE